MHFLYIFQLKKYHEEVCKERGFSKQGLRVIDELYSAFVDAERSCSGITDDFMTGILFRIGYKKLSEHEMFRAVENIRR